MKFTEKVLNKLLEIPRGKVTTYKLLAKSLDTTAYRLVGQIMKNNREPDRYPCYKVINSDGTVGEYSLGTGLKEEHLKRDGVEIKNGKINKKFIHRF